MMLLAIGAAQVALDREDARLREVRCLDALFGARDAIEAELAPGFDLADSQRAERELEEAVRAVEGVLDSTVFDATGRTLFDTDRSAIGETVPDAWQRAVGSATWRVASAGSVALGAPLHGASGAIVGQVVVTASMPGRAYPWAVAIASAALVAGFAAGLLLVPLTPTAQALQRLRTAPRTRLDDAQARVARAEDGLRDGPRGP